MESITEEEKLIEELADLEHEQWMHWTKNISSELKDVKIDLDVTDEDS